MELRYYFAWSSNETVQKMLLRLRNLWRRLSAGDLPARTDILTYILLVGLG